MVLGGNWRGGDRSLGTTAVYAHSPNPAGEWHPLADHLAGTAERARDFAEAFGAGDLGWAAGWLHDVGKCSTTFCAYLARAASHGRDDARRSFPRRDHKRPGALLAQRSHERIGTLLAATVLGHHGGLPDLTDARSILAEADADPVVGEALARAEVALGAGSLRLSPSGPAWITAPPVERSDRTRWLRDVEMLFRLVFSALVDADYLDTEAHFQPGRPRERRGHDDLAELCQRAAERRAELVRRSPASAVNTARSEVFDVVVGRAGEAPGIYQLAAATGSGKTITGLSWALAHARAHGLRRVVTAVPFITVTDQVATVYRSLLDAPGEDAVVEHHSQVAGDDGWQKLAAENWDAPVVVTTTVQLFESLFSNRTSACRKLHRLARSVIVVDEAQGIPLEVLEPVVDGLRALVDRFGASVLVMTATPPTLERIRPMAGRRAVELLPDTTRWAEAFRRTTFTALDEPQTHESVAGMVREHPRCLCVVNTIGDAREVTALAGPDVVHLSTRLRPAERRERLQLIRDRLDGMEPCRVVSTQLVEAGVDLDFPVVLRALGPLPALAQADGRCNRNGLLPEAGRTIVFELAGGKQPPGAYYSAGTQAARVVLNRPGRVDGQPPTLAEVEDWYAAVLGDQAVRTDRQRSGVGVQQAREQLGYATTNATFRMIDDDTLSVVVPWPFDDSRSTSLEAALAAISDRPPGSGSPGTAPAFRAIQDATVSLRRRDVLDAVAAGLATRVTDELYRWEGSYHPQYGLDFTRPREEDMIL